MILFWHRQSIRLAGVCRCFFVRDEFYSAPCCAAHLPQGREQSPGTFSGGVARYSPPFPVTAVMALHFAPLLLEVLLLHGLQQESFQKMQLFRDRQWGNWVNHIPSSIASVSAGSSRPAFPERIAVVLE